MVGIENNMGFDVLIIVVAVAIVAVGHESVYAHLGMTKQKNRQGGE